MPASFAPLQAFDHEKIDAHVVPGGLIVVEQHIVNNPITGERRVRKERIWRCEQVIVTGAYGQVRLERTLEGPPEVRAVKRLWTNGTKLKKEYQRELEALVEFSKPKYKQAAVFGVLWLV